MSNHALQTWTVLVKRQILYSQKIWQIKFGSLAVGIDTTKLKSANTIFTGDHNINDVMLQ